MLLNDFNVIELKEIYNVLSEYWGLPQIKFYKYNKADLVQLIRDSEFIIEKKENILVKINNNNIKTMKPYRNNFRFRYGKYHNYYNKDKVKFINVPITLNFD